MGMDKKRLRVQSLQETVFHQVEEVHDELYRISKVGIDPANPNELLLAQFAISALLGCFHVYRDDVQRGTKEGED